MQYPHFLKKSDWIGITACSGGRKERLDQIRLDHAMVQFQKRGYLVKETKDVRTEEKGRSAPARQRVQELYEVLEDDSIKAVIMASGGDYLLEMLPFLDYGRIGAQKKWIQGYSDPTGLLFTTTTLCDLATVYASNAGDFGMETWDESLMQNLGILEGENLEQQSFSKYMDGFLEKVTGLETYDKNQPVRWKCFGNAEEVTMSGRLLGGCLDVLLNLVGTKYDKTKEFVDRYQKDGILWYLESFDLNSEKLILGLWQLREAGWFEHASGFVFGRPTFFSTNTDTSYEEALHSVLEPLSVPVIYDACFGHKPPRMTIVNGAIGSVTCKEGKGSFRMEFRS